MDPEHCLKILNPNKDLDEHFFATAVTRRLRQPSKATEGDDKREEKYAIPAALCQGSRLSNCHPSLL
jgi:hypothetical protein